MNERLAKQRFTQLNLTRLVGVAFVFGGAANVQGGFAEQVSPYLGYVMLIFGVLDFFVAPVLLKRQWRQQDQ